MSKEILLSVQSKKLAEEAINEELKTEESNSTLKEFYIKLMNQLEIDGVPKYEISKVGSKILLDLKKEKLKNSTTPTETIHVSRYWYIVASDMGYTDPEYDHSSQDAELAQRENTSINTPFYKENKPIIDIIHRLKNHLSDILKIYEEAPHMSELDDDVKKNVRQSIHLMNQHIHIAEKIYNRKEKVPQNLQHILLYLLVTEGSVNDAAKAFLLKRMELLEFTSKQAGKLQDGTVPDLLPILKPTSRDIAMFLGYYGIQCKYCGSWEVKDQPGCGTETKVECWNCDGESWIPIKSILKCSYCKLPVYEEDLQRLLKGGKCKHCKKDRNELNYADESFKNEFDILLSRLQTASAFQNEKSITQDQRKMLSEVMEEITAKILV